MKLRSKVVAIALSATMAFSCAAMAACGDANSSNVDPEIYAVYTAYTESGGTLSYDEWYAQLLESAKGLKGDKGDQGDKGDKGDKGDTGEQGPQGEKGEKGDTGEQGPQGEKGETGETGAQGPQGEKGETGETGAQGPQGEKGEAGSSFLHGHGVPNEETNGKVGDLYLDVDTWNVYEMTEDGWSVQPLGNIKGEKGDEGGMLVDVTNETYGSFWLRCHDYKTMPIGAFHAITPVLREEPKLFAGYREAGLNMMIGFAEGVSMKTLDLCAENGLGYLISPVNCNHNYDKPSLQSAVSQVMYHQAFCGVAVSDEPGYLEFSQVKESQDFLDGLMPETVKGALWWTNVYPNHANVGQLYGTTELPPEMNGVYTYEQHINDYMEICKPQVLSFDNYAFRVGKKKRGKVRADYFENVSIIRNAALKANIPFWHFVLDCSFGDNVFVPNEGELQWALNTGLSFGAKGIQYFTGVQVDEYAASGWGGAIFDTAGNPTEMFDIVKRANQQIAAVDEVLMCSKSMGVMIIGDMPIRQTDDQPAEIPERDILQHYGEITTATGKHALIGCFNYNGKTAYYITNNTILEGENDTVTLNFGDTVSGYTVQKAAKEYFVSPSLQLTLDVGEGVLVVID